MSKLEDVSADALRERLAEVSDAKAAQRLMIALSYLDGEPVNAMSERYGIPKSTLYYWLGRFEERSIEEALTDEDRPGRPSELDDEEREQLFEHLTEPPVEHGYDADEWTVTLTRDHIEDSFGVTYSEGHVRRIIRQRDTD